MESYLIKPIQRILKYPLLLQQLKNLSDPQAEEHLHLIGELMGIRPQINILIAPLLVTPTEALKGMEKVAEHINEMQRIHEEYGAIFDHLFRQHQKACKQPIDLSPGKQEIYVYFGRPFVRGQSRLRIKYSLRFIVPLPSPTHHIIIGREPRNLIAEHATR